MKFILVQLHLVAALGALALVGCGGGGGVRRRRSACDLTVGGTRLAGPAGDSTLVLQNNGGDNLSITPMASSPSLTR